MNNQQQLDEQLDSPAADVGTLAPVKRDAEPWFDDDAPIRSMDPWASVRGLVILFLGVVAVVAIGWGTGILAPPGSSAGVQECARTCTSMGTTVASFTDGTCTCTSL